MVSESAKIDLVKEIKAPYYANGFVKGYYKGFSINLIKGPLANSASFATRDFLKRLNKKEVRK
jgi:hypothetical protein